MLTRFKVYVDLHLGHNFCRYELWDRGVMGWLSLELKADPKLPRHQLIQQYACALFTSDISHVSQYPPHFCCKRMRA